MMSKKPRLQETQSNSKTNKPTQRRGEKDQLTVPLSTGGEHAGSTSSKSSFSCGRSNHRTSRGGCSSVGVSEVGSSLKRSSLSHQTTVGHKGSRQGSHSGKPSFRLCGSRSFSSLHTNSVTAAPFIRSSRSLSRLDQRSTGEESHHAVPGSKVKRGQTSGKKTQESCRLSTSEEQIRSNKDQSQVDDEMKTSSSSELPESSSSSSTASNNQCNKVKEQSKDGAYTLCVVTTGMTCNWVQAVLKNVKSSLTPEVISTFSAQTTHQNPHQQDSDLAEFGLKCEDDCMQEHKTGDLTEDSHQQENDLQSEKEQSSAGDSSVLVQINPPQQVEDDRGPSSLQCPLLVGTSQTNLGSESHIICEFMKEKETLPCEDQQQTAELVKENDLLHPSGQALALQQLEKINNDLHLELEALKRSREEIREAELQRRANLLAQQAQLLVTGDVTALAQAHLEQDRQRFCEQQMKWEKSVSSLRSQLSISEEQKREAESRLTQLQQEMQSFHSLQMEAEQLRKSLHEVKTQLFSNEEAQAEKEARLQKHLLLLQASQDKERRSLAASLEQAGQHSQELQERLDQAEQRVQSLGKSQTWTKEIEEVQQQLQEELSRTVSAVEKLQEEREQLDQRCQELQNQLSEADGEVSRLQSRLKTEETHYYNLEHSYERVCEELQVALGKVQQREAEMQDIREGYERLLDRKEEELSEVLLKMEVLGNSLEETELKLNEVLNENNCASSQMRVELPGAPHDERQQQISTHPTLSDRKQKTTDSDQLSVSSNTTDIVQIKGNHSYEHMRNSSPSIDPSYECIVTAGDEPERFMSVIQLLESKLYVTEEKLKDITQRLEGHQNHISFQDPHLYSKLTHCRATAQHLSLLLHSQVKQSQRFAQETGNCCRMLVGRFHVALNIIQACRERLHATPINVAHFEKQLATVAACLQQGEEDAQKQQWESYNASKGEDKILNDKTVAEDHGSISAKSKTYTSEDEIASVRKHLKRELFVVEKMLSVLQNQHGIVRPVARGDEMNVAHMYKSLISQRLSLKAEEITHSRAAEYDSNEPLESAFGRFCAEGELIYAAFKFQQQYESLTQVNDQQVEHQNKGLADINPPELAPYHEQVKVQGRGSEEATKPDIKVQSEVIKVEAEKVPEWQERLVSRLKRRRKFLKQLCKKMSDGSGGECSMDYSKENDSQLDMNWMQEQVKLTYLSDRLHLDLEQEHQQSEMIQNKLQDLFKKRETTLLNERAAFNHTLCQLQGGNSILREELEQAEQKIIMVETENQRLLEDIQKIQDYHEERMQKLETKCQDKIQELQQIHEEEMKHLHGYYTKEKQSKTCTEVPVFCESDSSSDQTGWVGRGDAQVRVAYRKHLQKPENHAVSAMEEVHRKLIGELQQQHQIEVAALLKEKDQLLQEETAATLAAIAALRRAHKQELEKSRESQHIRERGDITQLHTEYKTEIQLLHKELEVLSVQHTQKCLENSQLSRELREERESLAQYQKENQELKKKQDKIYAQKKMKTLCMHNQDELHHDNHRLRDYVKFATWSPSRDTSGQSLKFQPKKE